MTDMTAEDLRKSILQQAIQGKLVPQNPDDEPASVLLERIRAEKARLVKEKKIKKDKNESVIFRGEDNSYYEKLADGSVKCIDEEIPFEIPESWEWVRFESVADIARGGSPRPIKAYLTESSNGVNWIKIGDTEKGGKCINSVKEKIKPEGVSSSRMVHKGDFLLTNSMSFGRPYITNVDGCIHDGWLVISPLGNTFNQDYLFHLLSSNFAYNQFSGKVSGAVVKNLNTDKVLDAIIPLPPLAEQKRIVERIEELMAKVEEYEKSKTALDKLESDLQPNLKKSILQYAIQGKLVPQNPDDEPASVLLERIRAEKARLVKEKKIKKDKNESIIFRGEDNFFYEKLADGTVKCIDEEIPFEIPESWELCRLTYIANIYTGNSINESEKKTKYTDVAGIEYIATKDVEFDNTINYKNGISIPEKYIENFRIAPTNSVLMCIEGGSAGRKIALTNQDVCFGNKLCCFSPYADITKYIYYYLQSPLFFDIFNSNKNGIIGGVSVNNLKLLLIPLPPLAEQKRIVAALEAALSGLDKIPV